MFKVVLKNENIQFISQLYSKKIMLVNVIQKQQYSR